MFVYLDDRVGITKVQELCKINNRKGSKASETMKDTLKSNLSRGNTKVQQELKVSNLLIIRNRQIKTECPCIPNDQKKT